MSVKIMGSVFDSHLERDKKFILLAFADHADHDGGTIYPSIATIARKTGYSERQVQRITASLINDGIMIRDGIGPHGAYRYHINLHKLNAYRPLNMGGDTMTPPPDGMGDISIEQGDISEPQGDKIAAPGVTPMSPESSFNHLIKPSIKTDSGVTHVTPAVLSSPDESDDCDDPPCHPDPDIAKAWKYCTEQLAATVPLQSQGRFLHRIRLSHRSDPYLFLVDCPDQATVDWCTSRLTTTLRRLLVAGFDHPVDIEFNYDPNYDYHAHHD